MKFSDCRSPDFAILVSRLFLGGVFVLQGGLKFFYLASFTASLGSGGFPFPAVCAAAIAAVELFGGLALVAGVFTSLAATLIALDMMVVLFAIQIPNDFGFSHIGVHFTILALGTSISLVFTGPGKWSVQSLWER